MDWISTHSVLLPGKDAEALDPQKEIMYLEEQKLDLRKNQGKLERRMRRKRIFRICLNCFGYA